MPTMLIVHAGLRPGELFIQRADRAATGQMVILPPASQVAHFDIQAGRSGGWNLVRKQGATQSPTLEEILVDFDSQEQAQEALLELTDLLMQEAPETGDATIAAQGKPAKRLINLRWPLVGLGVMAIALLLFVGKMMMAPGDKPMSTQIQAAPAASVGTLEQAAPAQTIPSPTPTAPASIPVPAQDNPGATPANNENLSPGDEFARMINGG